MPQRSNPFQHVVRLLHEQLADAAAVTESKFLFDRRDGEAHEVDVVIEKPVSGYTVTIGVECVDWSRKADIGWVEQMRGKHEDLPTDKVILVSSSGFSPRAMAKAEALGFVALSLEEAETCDWTQVVGKLATVYVELVESQQSVSVITRGDDGSEQIVPVGRDFDLRSAASGVSTQVGVLVDRIVAAPEVGRVLTDYMHQQGLSKNVFTAVYTFPKAMMANDAAGKLRQIVGLRIVLDSERAQTPVDLEHGMLNGAGIAYGEGEGGAGRLRVAIVERDGSTPVVEVLQQRGSDWQRVVHVDESPASSE